MWSGPQLAHLGLLFVYTKGGTAQVVWPALEVPAQARNGGAVHTWALPAVNSLPI